MMYDTFEKENSHQYGPKGCLYVRSFPEFSHKLFYLIFEYYNTIMLCKQNVFLFCFVQFMFLFDSV